MHSDFSIPSSSGFLLPSAAQEHSARHRVSNALTPRVLSAASSIQKSYAQRVTDVHLQRKVDSHVFLNVVRSLNCDDDRRMRILLKSTVDVNITYERLGFSVDHDTWTPLHFAAQRNFVNIMAVLLARGANVHAKDREGNTPLHMAANDQNEVVDNTEVLGMLLNAGADINARNHRGETPCDIAEQKEHILLLNYLRERGGKCASELIEKLMEDLAL